MNGCVRQQMAGCGHLLPLCILIMGANCTFDSQLTLVGAFAQNCRDLEGLYTHSTLPCRVCARAGGTAGHRSSLSLFVDYHLSLPLIGHALVALANGIEQRQGSNNEPLLPL
jgi:hypothetical protein